MYGIIYSIENKINNKKYIGQTTRTLESRVAEHFKNCKYDYLQYKVLYQAINKYGKENFISYELDEADTQEELDEKESYWIKYFDSYRKGGYNMTVGGQVEKKNHADEDISNKLSENLGGRPFLIYDMKGNFIRETTSQTVYAEELGCCNQSINNCLRGIKSQVKGKILIFKDEFTEEKLKEKINSRRKFQDFVVFDKEDNFIGQWDMIRPCARDLHIGWKRIKNYLINNNYHPRNSLIDTYKMFYLEDCPESLQSKIIINKKEE